MAYDDETRELTEEIRNAYTASCYDLANNGERVLGFADLELSPNEFPIGFTFKADPPNFPLENLRLVKDKTIISLNNCIISLHKIILFCNYSTMIRSV